VLCYPAVTSSLLSLIYGIPWVSGNDPLARNHGADSRMIGGRKSSSLIDLVIRSPLELPNGSNVRAYYRVFLDPAGKAANVRLTTSSCAPSVINVAIMLLFVVDYSDKLRFRWPFILPGLKFCVVGSPSIHPGSVQWFKVV
jgi:hypothetical protein